MTGKTHLYTGGFIGGASIILFTSTGWVTPESCMFFLIGTLIGSIAPDIDHSHSTISKKLGVIPGIIVQYFFGHRGIVHSIAFGAGISMVPTIIVPSFGIGLFIGWLSHLLLDMFTPSGVAILWPYRRDRYAILPELTSRVRKHTTKQSQYKKRNKRKRKRLI